MWRIPNQPQADLPSTAPPLRDAAANLIRPSVHCLKTEYHMSWALEDDGTPYTASQQVCRLQGLGVCHLIIGCSYVDALRF